MAFYNSVKDRTNFVLNFGWPVAATKNHFWVFARAYQAAANELAQSFLSKSGFLDYEGYPVVFLYRHSLECYLKGIMWKAMTLCAFNDVEFEVDVQTNHRLVPIAKVCTKILAQLWPDDDELSQFLSRLQKIASEFEEIDRDSYAYRYPIDKHGKPSTKRHQIVNMTSLYNTMSEVLEGLDAIESAVEWELDQSAEIYEVLVEAKHLITKQE